MTTPLAAPHLPENASEASPPPRELDLFAFAMLLLANLRFLLLCGIVSFLVMVAYMLHVKPRFASTAVMVIPQTNPKVALLEAQLSASTADLLGGGYELYADILQSRSVLDELIKNHNLMAVYHAKEIEQAEFTLTSLTKVETQREGILRVTVQDSDPNRAADIANDYLQQLNILNQKLVLTAVGQQRVFIEREMIKEKNALADAEVALKEVQESTSGLPPEASASAALNGLETTRVQLRAEQVRLNALLQSETDENPEVVRLRSEIEALTGQLAALQRGSTSLDAGTPTSKVPEQALVYTRRLREVKFHEALFDLLAKQFEQAKEQESRNPNIVQVLDAAVPAPHKSWPPRTMYCLLGGIAGVALGILWVVFHAFVRVYVLAPRNSERLEQVRLLSRRQFGWKS
jgi:tyrosine-protein kinase Etk/Wzc